jgi:hypothetical protein
MPLKNPLGSIKTTFLELLYAWQGVDSQTLKNAKNGALCFAHNPP